MIERDSKEHWKGLTYGLMAFAFWGAIPVFWKQITAVSSLEILGHRVAWAAIGYVFIVGIMVPRAEMRALWMNRRAVGALVVSASLLAVNWFTYVYAVNTDRILQASLGYFINPTVSMLLGMLFFGERLRRAQWLCVACVSLGVALQATRAQSLPWLALVLALTFGLYGVVRKKVSVRPILGSAVEVAVLLGPALVLLASLARGGQLRFGTAPWGRVEVFLILSGAVTILPLVWFGASARRLPLTLLGFLQYVAPSGQFLLAVGLYGEPFGVLQALSFSLIWLGLVLLSIEVWWHRRADLRSSRVAPSVLAECD